jgi:hypothetical protein
MIVVKIELWPGGDSSRAIDLGKAHIANESDLAPSSTYSVRLLKGARYSSRPGDVYKTGEVRGFPRNSVQVGPWELLYLAIESAIGDFRIQRARRLCREGRKEASK